MFRSVRFVGPLAFALAVAAHAQTPTGTAFTYQGQLKDGGTPVNTAAGSFEFRLFDAATAGNPVGNVVALSNVPVTNGLFSVSLDFGAAAFGPDARWLEVRVFKDGTGWTTLSPRHRITPAPQARFAQNAGSLAWPLNAAFPGGVGINHMLRLDYAGEGRALEVRATGVDAGAIYAETTEGETVAILGQVAGEASAAVVGQANATGPNAAGQGGLFMSRGGRGTGVAGVAGATSGENYAVYGETLSPAGYAGFFLGRGYFRDSVGVGVEQPVQKLDVGGTVRMSGFQLTSAPTAGYVLTSDGNGFGTWQPAAGGGPSPWQVNGATVFYLGGNVGIGTTNPQHRLHVDGGAGTAIFGQGAGGATAGTLGHGSAGVYGTGSLAGVTGLASGTAGRGVVGEASAGSGDTRGVYGKSASPSGSGVYGEATANSGTGTGVFGRSSGPYGRGVYGEASAATGTPIGVEAYAGCSGGTAVLAFNEAEEGAAVAVRGHSNSPSGVAVWGTAGFDGSTGSATGVLGETGGTGAGIIGRATHASAATYGVKGEASSPNGYGGYFQGRGYFSGNLGVGVPNPAQKLDVAGTIQATGFKLTTAATAGYVLTCDAAGAGSWQPPPAGGDSLWQASGTDVYYSAGRVGVGTSTPGARLDLAGGDWDLVGTEGDFRIGSSSYRLKFGVATSGGSAGLARIRAQGITGTPKVVLGAGNFDTLTVTSTNVGVGTLAPDSGAKLDVAGKLRTMNLQVTTGATAGYVLTADAGGNATWQAPTGGGGLTLPYDGSGSDSIAAFKVTNTHATAGAGIFGVATARGVRGQGGTEGVSGFSAGGSGVFGSSNSGIGVKAQSGGTGTANPALYVSNINSGGIGIFSTCGSSDANAVFVNTSTGDIIKGFSGSGGGNLVFRVENNGKTTVSVLQITGGADLSERFDVRAAEAEPQAGMVVCIDPSSPGKLVVSTRAYDRTVAGVLSGAGGVRPGMLMGQSDSAADGAHPVALTGRVYVWADATASAIEPGDLLTTADVPGHAMKVTDHARAPGAVLGKAMSRLESGRGLVLVLVNLQ